MKTATLLKEAGTSKLLYELDPPIESEGWDGKVKTHKYVVVSAVNAMFTGPETYIFPADKEGHVVDWLELRGSYRGGLNHEAALRGAGYRVVSAPKKKKTRKSKGVPHDCG
jgi:hypothetical protein